jgi:hypothetical protein
MSAYIVAVVGIALFANTPQSVGKANLLWVAGFPFTYAQWWSGNLTRSSIAALVGDIAIPAAVVMTLGVIAVRSKISGGESETTDTEDFRPPLAENRS